MGFNLCTLDTNVLLRVILNDNGDHNIRARSLINTPGMYFTILDQVVLEMNYVLSGTLHYPRSVIVDLITSTLAEPRLDYNEKLFKKVFDLYLARPKLSLTDCYMAFKTEEIGHTPLYTFDGKLVKQFPSAKLIP